MKNNYPIVYALMPIYEQTGWNMGVNELERRYDVVCYIVSKCYLISTKNKFQSDGKSTSEYEVVFPYQENSRFSQYEYISPEYNLINYRCINSTIVSRIFNSREDALKYANEENDKLKSKKCEEYFMSSLNDGHEKCVEEVNKAKEEFDALVAKYKTLENGISSETESLSNSDIKVLDNLIILDEKGTRECYCNLYEFLRNPLYDEFVIYSVSEELYDDLSKGGVSYKEGSDAFPPLPTIYKTSDKDYFVLYDSLSKKSMILTKYGTLKEMDSEASMTVSRDAACFFTTEKYDDVFKSFNKHADIELTSDGYQVKKLEFKNENEN